MPFDKTLPTWGNAGAAPPAFKQTEGWKADEHPPASIFNWFFYTVYQALQELQQEALNTDQKGINNGLATLDATGDLPIGQADNILNWVKGFGLGGLSKQLTSVNDLNTLADTHAFYYASGSINKPTADNGWLIHQPMSSTYSTQLFTSIAGKVYSRVKNNNVWGAWIEQETTTGAQAKATAAQTTAETNAKNASVPRNDARVNSADLNTYITTGITAIGSPVTNGPAGAAYGNLMVFNSAGDRITQMFTNPGSSAIFVRHGQGTAPRVWTTWETLETAAGAQTKATTAETNAVAAAKVYAPNAVSVGLTADPNTTTESYIVTDHANGPGDFWHIFTMFYSSKTSSRAQIAIRYAGVGDSRLMTRRWYNGVWTAWAEHETTTGAQTKATAAQTAAINYAKGYGLGTLAALISATDLNVLKGTGFYRGSAMINAPTGGWYYIINMEHTGSYVTQIAYELDEDPKMLMRVNKAGTWTAWVEYETTAGAQAKADTAAKTAVDQTTYKTAKSAKDAEGVYTTVEYRRKADDTLAARAVLSGGTSPLYTTRTITHYAADGTTVAKTDTFALTYDADGILIGEA